MVQRILKSLQLWQKYGNVDLVIAEAKRSAGLVALAAQEAEPATQNLIQLNGRYYHVAITSLKRSHNMTDGENAGRTKPPLAEMIRDIVGTFISYTAVFEVKSTDVWEYDDMIATLRQPVDYDAANSETRKMIVAQLIERVDVFRGYELKIKFTISVEQFLIGLDIST